MTIEWEETWEPLSPEEIRSLEQSLGVALPGMYSEFLETVHGYIPVHCCLTVPRGAGLETTAEFLCGRGDSPDSIIWAQTHAYEGSLAGTIPTAVDAGGNYFVIEPKSGRILFFFHDQVGSPFIPVTDSFHAFLSMLHEDDEDLPPVPGVLAT